MTNNEAHELLIEWLGTLLGVPVIKDRQQALRPALPYCMVDLANWRPIDQHVTDIIYTDTATPNSEGKLEVEAVPDYEIEWVFLFFAYGAQGENLVRRLQSAVHLTQLQEPLRPLVIHEVSGGNSLPEFLGEKWEPRSQVNIVVRGKSSDGFIVDIVEDTTLTITGERA